MEFIHDPDAFRRYIASSCGCINAVQSREERRMKYKLARHFRCSWQSAQRYRDWRKSPFAKRFGYSSWDSMITSLTKDLEESEK